MPTAISTKVKLELGAEEYRLVIDGDDSGEFVPYGDICEVEQPDGSVYWAYAADDNEEWPVYHGKRLASVEYEDVIIDADGEDDSGEDDGEVIDVDAEVDESDEGEDESEG